MGKSTKATTNKRSRAKKQTLANRVKAENAIIEKFTRQSDKRLQALMKKLDTGQMTAAIKAAEKKYDAAFKTLKIDKEQLDELKNAARKMARETLLRGITMARVIIEFHNQGTKQLNQLLAAYNGNGSNQPLQQQGELATEDLLNNTLFEPPFDFLKYEKFSDHFKYDYSVALPEWGLVVHSIRFMNSQSYGDAVSSFSKVTKAGDSTAIVGVNYVMPSRGRLEVFVAYRKIFYDVKSWITPDGVLFYTSLNYHHKIWLEVSGTGGLEWSELDILREEKKGAGAELFDPPPSQEPQVISIVTTSEFAAGDNIEISVASTIKMISHVVASSTDVDARITLKIEKIYVRVVV